MSDALNKVGYYMRLQFASFVGFILPGPTASRVVAAEQASKQHFFMHSVSAFASKSLPGLSVCLDFAVTGDLKVETWNNPYSSQVDFGLVV